MCSLKIALRFTLELNLENMEAHTKKSFTFFVLIRPKNLDDALASGLEQELSSSEMGGYQIIA